MNIKFAAAAVVAVGLAGVANATTYIGQRSIDGATAALSITTDGTLGVLGQANVTSWDILLTDSAGTFELTPGNSEFDTGGDLSATATALSFNFSGNSIALWENLTIGDDGPFYCVTNGGCFGESGPAEGLSTQNGESPIEQVAQTGEVVLATAGGVPEPATWALMLVGVGGIGAAMRRRPRTVVA